MVFPSICVFASLLLTQVVAGPLLFDHSDVIVELTPATFSAVVLSDERVWVVNLYADWCPHCQNFAPSYETLAAEFSGRRVRFGALDCAQWVDFCRDMDVHSYPTLRHFHLTSNETSTGTDIDWHYTEDGLRQWLTTTVASLPSASTDAVPAPVPGAAPQTPRPQAQPAGSNAQIAFLRLADAEIALRYTLRQGVFLQADTEDGSAVLRGEPLADLEASLEFFAGALPGRSCTDLLYLAEVVARARSNDGALTSAVWAEALSGRAMGGAPPEAGDDPSPYWRLCTTYTCGLWSLFHIIMASAVHEASPQSTALRSVSVSRNNSTEPLARIRTFVDRFFGCRNCAEHFVDAYDSCSFDRCDADSQDAAGSAVWLWRAHNEVAARVADEQHRAPPDPWPALEECELCRSPGAPAGADWRAPAVANHLQSVYWAPDWRGGQAGAGFPGPEPNPWLARSAAWAAIILVVLVGAWCLSRPQHSGKIGGEETEMAGVAE